MIEDQEVEFKRRHVYHSRQNDETEASGNPMFHVRLLQGITWRWNVRPQAQELTTGILRSPNFSQRSSIVYAPTSKVTKRPTHFTLEEHLSAQKLLQLSHGSVYLVTQPIESPVSESQSHQSIEKDLNFAGQSGV